MIYYRYLCLHAKNHVPGCSQLGIIMFNKKKWHNNYFLVLTSTTLIVLRGPLISTEVKKIAFFGL